MDKLSPPFISFLFSICCYRTVNVSLPLKTRKNGTLHLHVFVYPKSENPFESKLTSHGQTPITTFMVPQSTVFSLLGDKKIQVCNHVPGGGAVMSNMKLKKSSSKVSGWFSNHFVEIFLGWPYINFLQVMLIGHKTWSPGAVILKNITLVKT